MKKTDETGRRKSDKIEPFRITDDMLLDREMDEFIRQSMIEEADRLEEELNSDPELMGIGASDDLFLKIKARLQEMGAWEEEDDEEDKTEESKPEIYQLLSEEDKEALEIGRKIRKRREKKGRYWKKAVVAVVVLAVLFAVGMQGGASRNWILGALDRFIAVAGNRLQIDYQDEKENVRLNEEKEQEAWEKVKEELGIPVIEFFYKPEEMIFNNVRISKETGEAMVNYWYKETVAQVYLKSGESSSSFSFISEKDALLQDVIVSNQEIEIKIWNTTAKSIESYAASFEYQDVLYFISGQLPFEEVEKMMDFISLY